MALAHSFSVTVTTTPTTLTSLATTALKTIEGGVRRTIKIYNHNNANPNGNAVPVFSGVISDMVTSGTVAKNGTPTPVGAERVYYNQEPDELYLMVAAATLVVHIEIEGDNG